MLAEQTQNKLSYLSEENTHIPVYKYTLRVKESQYLHCPGHGVTLILKMYVIKSDFFG